MLLFKASIAAGIVAGLVLGVTGIVDLVNAFVFGSAVAGVSYVAGTMIKPGSNTSIMSTPGSSSKTED